MTRPARALCWSGFGLTLLTAAVGNVFLFLSDQAVIEDSVFGLIFMAMGAVGALTWRQPYNFCTLEALNNVAKYTGATRAEVHLSQTNEELTFDIVDDWASCEPSETGFGTGVQGMADRLDALGGTIDVRSAPGSGTTITGVVPVAR